MKKTSGVVVAVFAGLMLSVAPASADAADNAFIQALDGMGIKYTNPGAVIAAGRSVCDGFDQGYSFDAVTLAVSRAGSQLTSVDQAANFVRAATLTYCTQHVDPGEIGRE
ncbi:LprJ protein [Mycobacteroides abscessus subsp. bolletii]|nr:LprJ protein [Mycobacteroides abscessus subsp. bolletii]